MAREGYLSEENVAHMLSELGPYVYPREPYWVGEKMAIVVLNPINFFFDESMRGYVPSTDYLKDVLPMLILRAKEKNIPVFFIRHGVKNGKEGNIGKWWGYPVYENSKDSMLYPMFAELPGIEFVKERYSAFSSHMFVSALEMENVKTLVLTGVLLDLSVMTTALDAFDRDFNVVVPIDGVATHNYDLHIASMKLLTHGCAFTATVEEVVSAL